jgi:hypothetical protein
MRVRPVRERLFGRYLPTPLARSGSVNLVDLAAQRWSFGLIGYGSPSLRTCCNCLVLLRRVHLDDVGGDKDNIVLSIVLMPVHRGSWLSGRVARVKGL